MMGAFETGACNWTQAYLSVDTDFAATPLCGGLGVRGKPQKPSARLFSNLDGRLLLISPEATIV